MTQKKHSNKKKILAILLCLLTVAVLIVGSIFAFFSDVFTGSETLTAGTLELDGSVKFYLNGSGTEATAPELACINPGDTVKVVISAANIGSKSAWLKSEFKISSAGKTGAQLNGVFAIYEGTSLVTPLSPTVGTNDLTIAGSAVVVDGTYETETVAGGTAAAIESASTTLTYTIVFATTADNTWQNATMSIGCEVKALQFRNNPTPNWATAVALI